MGHFYWIRKWIRARCISGKLEGARVCVWGGQTLSEVHPKSRTDVACIILPTLMGGLSLSAGHTLGQFFFFFRGG